MLASLLRFPLFTASTIFLSLSVVLWTIPIPPELFPFSLAQTALPAALAGIALCTAGTLLLVDFRSVSIPAPVALAGLPLVVVAVLSALITSSSGAAWQGLGFSEGTVGFFLLFAGVIAAGALLHANALRPALAVFIGSAAVGVGVAALSTALVPAVFNSEAIAGSWPRFSFLAATGLAAVALAWEGVASRSARAFYVLSGAVLLTGFILFFHAAAALSLVVALGLYAAIAFTGGRKIWAPTGVIIVVLFLLFLGLRSPVLLVPSEVRPSFYVTQIIASPALIESLSTILLGTGPDSFSSVWEKYRPFEFNRSTLGQTEFQDGFSTVLTLLVELGVFGFLAFAFLVGLALFFLFTSFPTGGPALHVAPTLATLAFMCFFSLGIGTPGSAVFLLGGSFLGMAARARSGGEAPVRIGPGIARGITAAVPLIALGVLLVGVSGRQIAAAFYHERGGELLARREAVEAVGPLARAAHWWGASEYWRDAARAEVESVFIQLEARGEQEPLLPEAFHKITHSARLFADSAVAADPLDWRSLLACGSLYLSLYTAVEGAYAATYREQAEHCLNQAAQLVPSRPDVPYAQARAAFVFGEQDAAREYLAEALRLKPDYAPALELQGALGR